MPSPQAYLLFSLVACPSLVFALPPAAASCRPLPQQQPPWRRFTNTIVQHIFGLSSTVPLKTPPPSPCHGASSRSSARYGRDVLLRFNVSTPYEARSLAVASEELYLDVWEFNENWVDVRLAKDVVPSLLGLLPPSLHKAHAPLMPYFGLAEVVDQSIPSTGHRSFTPSLLPHSKDLFFSDYQPLSVITPWMKLMNSMFPTHVQIINIGISWEGRDIPALRVGVHPTNNEEPSAPRKTIVISGGTHAREWISTSTVLYVANTLITSYGKSQEWTSLVEAFDWIFIPTLNPDGYVYTWENDRLWRKNRQPTSLRFCRGIDLDRAYGFHWDGDAASGGSNPCSESYAGEEPWQAVEAKAFADWARNETDNNNVEFVSLIDLHSYSQQVLYPYSYSCDASPPTLEDLEELAFGLAKAMHQTNKGHYYKTTSACEGNVALSIIKGRETKQRLPRIETGGGSLLDWFYHEMKIRYSYQIKLRDMGSYGFLLPKENIVPQGREMVQAVTYLGRYLMGQVGLSREKLVQKETQDEGFVVVTKADVQEDELADDEIPPTTEDSDIQWELRRRRRR
ncbi:putative zinc carboxypeptidase protein [Venturia nashicola]|nr:putative zinc carboxypeptidase protein [Venturia nashicola]